MAEERIAKDINLLEEYLFEMRKPFVKEGYRATLYTKIYDLLNKNPSLGGDSELTSLLESFKTEHNFLKSIQKLESNAYDKFRRYLMEKRNAK